MLPAEGFRLSYVYGTELQRGAEMKLKSSVGKQVFQIPPKMSGRFLRRWQLATFLAGFCIDFQEVRREDCKQNGVLGNWL